MRAINYLRELFVSRFKENKPIQPTENMLKALNQIIDVVNTGIHNSEFEDSLLLYYILGHYKLVNDNNKVKISTHDNKLGVLSIKDCDIIMQKLSMLIAPKEFIIQEITNELHTNQASLGVSKEEYIPKEQVAEQLEVLLQRCKLNFFQNQNL